MNFTNKDVFELYFSINNKKRKKTKTKKKLGYLFKYAAVGYIFKLKKDRVQMEKCNEFIETNNEYHNLKLVVYTVVSGKYDEINEPIYRDSNIDYYIFTDQTIPNDSAWKIINFKDIHLENMSPLEQARYVKTHPHEFFKDYDYSMFIDGNIKLTCDVKPLFYSLKDSNNIMGIHHHQCRDCAYVEARVIYAQGRAKLKDIYYQMQYYKKAGFPKKYGLFETNVLIRQHNNPKCIKIMEEWWEQIRKFTKRDQLSFTYSLWKNNMTSDDIFSLGNNSRNNPYFIVSIHK